MKNHHYSNIHKTPNRFTHINVSPPLISEKFHSKNNVKSCSSKSISETFNIKFSKTPLSNIGTFPISDLDQMQKDFYENSNKKQILFSPEFSNKVCLCTPENPNSESLKKEPKIEYQKNDPNRTNITPFSPFTKILNKTKSNNPKIDLDFDSQSAGNNIRLHIQPSYCFESQISDVSLFTLCDNKKQSPKLKPAPITVNQNVVSSQLKNFEFDLDEIDAISFEASKEISKNVLNPNDVTGILKPLFPNEKSGKKINESCNEISLFGGTLEVKKNENFSKCSCLCKCDPLSRPSKKNTKNNHLNFMNPFKPNLRKSKYISNRMKFEQQGQKKRLSKCKCRSLRRSKLTNAQKPSFVSEFFIPRNSKADSKKPSDCAFSHLDIKHLSLHTNDIFGNGSSLD
jgi:hypothetical protein